VSVVVILMVGADVTEVVLVVDDIVRVDDDVVVLI
jgi:hypothetical protein